MWRAWILGGLFVCVFGLSLVGPADAAIITGRVVDSAGRPVAGAAVRIWQTLPAPDGRGISDKQMMFDGGEVLTTDAEGRFASPDVLVGEAFARIVAEAGGRHAGRSGWIEIRKDASVAAPDIMLQRLRAILGKVVDRAGQPLAGVTVFNIGDGHERVEAKSGQGGRFFLNGVPEGGLFLFAEKSGYRFTGIRLTADQRDAAFTLASADEPIEPLTTLAPVLSAEEEIALARKAFDPWFDATVKSDSESQKFWALSDLADLDPLEAHHRARGLSFADARYRRFLDQEILNNCLKRTDSLSSDELRALIESLDPSLVAGAYVAAVRTINRKEPRHRQWLVEALTRARRIEDPAERAESLAAVAGGMFDAGDEQQADAVLAEAEKIAEPLLPSDEASSAFRLLALNLAKRDPARATAWLERINNVRLYVNFGADLAVKLLPDHPADAEDVWRRTTDRIGGGWRRFHIGERGMKLAELCYRMSRVDRPRAERMAREVMLQPLRVRALGAIALGLADTDPAAARSLLAAIVTEEISHPLVDDEFEPFGFAWLAPPLTVAWLLPIAERIDPQLARELFWRSLASRPLRPRRDKHDDEDVESDINLAMMLSRYDRDTARALLEPLVARLPEFGRPTLTQLKSRESGALAMRCRSLERTIVSAAARIDPRWAAKICQGLPPDESATLGSFQVVEALVNTLCHQGADRWGQDHFFSAFSANYWKPKTEPGSRQSTQAN